MGNTGKDLVRLPESDEDSCRSSTVDGDTENVYDLVCRSTDIVSPSTKGSSARNEIKTVAL